MAPDPGPNCQSTMFPSLVTGPVVIMGHTPLGQSCVWDISYSVSKTTILWPWYVWPYFLFNVGVGGTKPTLLKKTEPRDEEDNTDFQCHRVSLWSSHIPGPTLVNSCFWIRSYDKGLNHLQPRGPAACCPLYAFLFLTSASSTTP